MFSENFALNLETDNIEFNKNSKAPGEDRTRDLSLTKRTHYHYATEALNLLIGGKLIISSLIPLDGDYLLIYGCCLVFGSCFEARFLNRKSHNSFARSHLSFDLNQNDELMDLI